jgi:hypothetical protein
MKSLLHITSAKKFVVPSLAVMLTLASTMFMAPVFAVGFFLNPEQGDLQTNSDGSLTATYEARGFSSGEGGGPGAEVFLTSNIEVEFTCTNDQGKAAQSREITIELTGEADNFDSGSHDDEVSIGPPSTTAEDLCKGSNKNVEVEKITYTDIVLHAVPNDSTQPEVTHQFENVKVQ